MMKRIAIVLMTFSLTPLSAVAITNGDLSPENAASAVGFLGQKGKPPSSVSCTATLIAPEWIVTAQHCRWGGSEEEPILMEPKDLFFTLTGKNKQTISLVDWVDGPELMAGVASDVAFARLAAKPKQVEPLPINVTELLGNTAVKVFGFGATDFNGTRGFGVLRTASLVVTGTQGNALMRIFQEPGSFEKYLQRELPGEVSALERHLEHSALIEDYTAHVWAPRSGKPDLYQDTCYGDSGGPVIAVVSGRSHVVGITSSGFPGDTYSCAPLGTIIGVFGPLLQQKMRAHGIPFIGGRDD